MAKVVSSCIKKSNINRKNKLLVYRVLTWILVLTPASRNLKHKVFSFIPSLTLYLYFTSVQF